MYKTRDRRAVLVQCARVFIISLIVGIAFLILRAVIGSSSQPAQAWESSVAEAQAQAGTILISPTFSTVNVGESVTVTVWLSDVADYYGVEFRIAFDPSIVEVPSGQVTPLWEVFDSSNHWIAKNQADNVNGEIWYALTNLNPAEPFTGTGRVCDIAFKALAPVSTTLHFSYTKGSTRDLDSLYPMEEDGEIEVMAGATFELTPTTDYADTPYAIHVFTLTLTNNDTAADIFWFTDASTSTSALPSPDNLWNVIRPVSITVGAGLSATVPVTIEIPEAEAKWVTHTATITVTSQNHSTAGTSLLTTFTGGHWDPACGSTGCWVGCRFDLGFTGEVNFDDVREVFSHFGSTTDLLYDYGHTHEVNFTMYARRSPDLA